MVRLAPYHSVADQEFFATFQSRFLLTFHWLISQIGIAPCLLPVKISPDLPLADCLRVIRLSPYHPVANRELSAIFQSEFLLTFHWLIASE